MSARRDDSGPMRVLLGIDSGQIACKAALFDLEGREVTAVGVSNAVSSPHPRWVERDMEELWEQVSTAVRSATTQAQGDVGPVEIIGVGVCGHGDGAYLVDEELLPVRSAILATDSRAGGEAAEFGRGQLGRRVLELTGQVPNDGSPASILAWLAHHEPESLAKARWALSCKDFIRLRLTGQVATDPSDASASFADVTALDRRAGAWSSTALGLFGLGDLERLLPPILPSAHMAGVVSEEAAEATGLPAGTPVVTGAHDVDAAAIGIGAHTVGSASVVLGTFSINQVVSDHPVVDRRWQARSFVQPRQWLHMSTSPAGATNLDWAVRRIGPWAIDGTPDFAQAITEAREIAVEVTGRPARTATAPLFLPFLYGAPVLHRRDAGDEGDAQRQGEAHAARDVLGAGWIDVHPRHERGDMLWAVLEGVAFNHRTHLDALQAAFQIDRPLRVCGGGARSTYWTQMLADVVGHPVEVTDADETGARGAALLAGVATGAFSDLNEAVERSVHVVRRHDPRPQEASIHARRHERYLRVIDVLR